MRVRAHALAPDHLMRAPTYDLGLLRARVAERVTDHKRAVPGKSLEDDSRKLPDRGPARQLTNEDRRTARPIRAELLDDVLPVMAGDDPSQGIRVTVLIHDTAVAEGDHADVPCVPRRLANHDGPVGQHATGSQHRELRGSRSETDGGDTVACSVYAEDLESVG